MDLLSMVNTGVTTPCHDPEVPCLAKIGYCANDPNIHSLYHPNLEGENPGGGQGPPISLPLPPTTREDLRLDGYLEHPYAAKAIYKKEGL
ncbi:hypothetical protein TNCV_4309371 [Trichonephila clavipes]|nr:hypothetical protein TNCV_4309371 [Trichonephila clavipes]